MIRSILLYLIFLFLLCLQNFDFKPSNALQWQVILIYVHPVISQLWPHFVIKGQKPNISYILGKFMILTTPCQCQHFHKCLWSDPPPPSPYYRHPDTCTQPFSLEKQKTTHGLMIFRIREVPANGLFSLIFL